MVDREIVWVRSTAHLPGGWGPGGEGAIDLAANREWFQGAIDGGILTVLKRQGDDGEWVDVGDDLEIPFDEDDLTAPLDTAETPDAA